MENFSKSSIFVGKTVLLFFRYALFNYLQENCVKIANQKVHIFVMNFQGDQKCLHRID